MYKEFAKKGLALAAVNPLDGNGVVAMFYLQGGFTFPSLIGEKSMVIATSYNVNSYPTNYVIDSSGKIVASFDGFDEAGIRAALKKLGIE